METPEEGDLWYCSQADQEGLYCWDGAVWFGTDSPDSAGLEDAPEDGKQYARRNASWSEVVIPTVDLNGYATEVYVDECYSGDSSRTSRQREWSDRGCCPYLPLMLEQAPLVVPMLISLVSQHC